MSIGNDAPRVSVRKRGRPSFLVLLNARDPTPGHSYLRLLRRKCLPPSAPRVRLRTLNRTSYESRNAMTDEPHRTMEAGCIIPKNGADSSAESAPKREWQSKNVDGREECPQVSWHHIPPAKGMGERALLLLGLLSLLTAADEVRNADAQHRATSDPSEGHAVKTGQREVGALLVLDGKGDGAAVD